jgi:hypothetical protein
MAGTADAVDAAGAVDPAKSGAQNSAAGRKRIEALFKRSVFEGNRMVLIAELKGGLEFSVEGRERIPLPAAGERIVLELDESTLKFLIPGTD